MDLSYFNTVNLLNVHRASFYYAKTFADVSGHTVPCDTKSWSQILVSFLTGIRGLDRKKGADLIDGSDVKAANAWDAIDKPRFNGVLMAGRVGADHIDISNLNTMPFLFFVLWDWLDGKPGYERCRVWYVNTQLDDTFRQVAQNWYDLRKNGEIKSANFQLHPPIHRNDNIVTNECGNMELPILLEAHWDGARNNFIIDIYEWDINNPKFCLLTGQAPKRRRNA